MASLVATIKRRSVLQLRDELIAHHGLVELVCEMTEDPLDRLDAESEWW